MIDPATVQVIAPNLKKRYSGVTSTVLRLVPLQARDIAIASVGPKLPAEMPQIRIRDLLTMPRRKRVWHARRNNEMLVGLLLRHVLRQPLKLMFTSAAQRDHSGWTKWLIARQDKVVATSARSAAFLKRDAQVIHHGIDTDHFCPATDRAALRRQLALPVDATLLGCFGRVRPSKGNDLFIDAMIAVLPQFPQAHAVMMGGVTDQFSGFMDKLRARVAASDVADRIHILPEDPGWTIAPWFQAIDLYIAPQRNEGFGLTPLEAMSCGVPSIATRTGAFEEIVADGETGTLIPTEDYPALETAIRSALADPATLSRWSAACRPRAVNGFHIADEAAALVAIYRDLLDAR
ncbi:glycosyltransferase family 4 protein [Loktanella sp. SALINAS62]|uniref:glycosyltransferase family 4 protein n=1 Tax=Loktanella sp. SALINAS62 TaxID=2706124 RepID=UPI001B8BBA14|nr:glycosyltransferase family 4 protein [Loktanella sp. SALINAS62]MBS1304231.1 glycosyltransferase family 4 protein [Loktanella sp. SALINAS62]